MSGRRRSVLDETETLRRRVRTLERIVESLTYERFHRLGGCPEKHSKCRKYDAFIKNEALFTSDRSRPATYSDDVFLSAIKHPWVTWRELHGAAPPRTEPTLEVGRE